MKLKINEQLLCIPPYISTTWDQVAFLQTDRDPETKQPMLILHLLEGKVIVIPNLDSSIIDIAFAAHLKHLEQSTQPKETQFKTSPSNILQQLFGISPDQIAAFPIRFGISGLPGIENLESAFQHSPAQAETPDLPNEILEKIAGITKLMTNGDLAGFPKPEPHCNCTHCQLSRSIHGIAKGEEEGQMNEPISEEDLSFRSWDIKQSGNNLYIVTNPLDPKEQYSVFLGTPVGCTCGTPHCEHIQAVLYS